MRIIIDTYQCRRCECFNEIGEVCNCRLLRETVKDSASENGINPFTEVQTASLAKGFEAVESKIK